MVRGNVIYETLMAFSFLLLIAVYLVLSYDCGRLEDSQLAWRCTWGLAATFALFCFIPLFIYCGVCGWRQISSDMLLAGVFIPVILLLPHLLIRFLVSAFRVTPLKAQDFKRCYRRIGKYGILIGFPVLFIIYHLFDQPDSGGNEACYRMSGIDIEKNYGGDFIPTYEFMPNPFAERYRFRINNQDFYRLNADLIKRGYDLFTFTSPGTDIAESGIAEISYRKTSSLIVWMHYKRSEGILYVGGFRH